MNDFAIIPALDLKGGAVVHARGGARAEYRPIETPLGAADDPVALARALLAVTGSSVLYIADLDAIEGVGNHFDVCRDLASALPGSELWIDAGFTNVTDCAFWLPLGATLVIGTESLSFAEDWQERIIAMSLDRVGTGHGPDVARLRDVVDQAGARSVYASGGMRDIGDLEAAAEAGAGGALIATALHRGAVGQKEIAAFEGRRRSRSD